MSTRNTSPVTYQQAMEIIRKMYEEDPEGGTKLRTRISRASGKAPTKRTVVEPGGENSYEFRQHPEITQMKDVTKFSSAERAKVSPLYKDSEKWGKRKMAEGHVEYMKECRAKPGQDRESAAYKARVAACKEARHAVAPPKSKKSPAPAPKRAPSPAKQQSKQQLKQQLKQAPKQQQHEDTDADK